MKPVYEEINRRAIVAKAAWECLKYLYKIGYPSVDLDAYNRSLRDNSELKESEEKYPVYRRCYVPQEVFQDVEETFLEAYRIKPELKETVAILKGYFKEPLESDWTREEGRTYKTGIPMPEDIQKVVEEYLDKAVSFYRWDGDEQQFRFTLANLGPTSNRETVEEYHRLHTRPDFTLPEDSYWAEDEE